MRKIGNVLVLITFLAAIGLTGCSSGGGADAKDNTVAATVNGRNVMLGEVDRDDAIDRTTLRTLIADPEPVVVDAALHALRWPEDAELLSAVADHLDHRRQAISTIST